MCFRRKEPMRIIAFRRVKSEFNWEMTPVSGTCANWHGAPGMADEVRDAGIV